MLSFNKRNPQEARAWLEARYPIQRVKDQGQLVYDIEQGSPLYRFLLDEKKLGHGTHNLELYLTREAGGEFPRWIEEESELTTLRYHTERFEGVEPYYPQYIDPVKFAEDAAAEEEEEGKDKSVVDQENYDWGYEQQPAARDQPPLQKGERNSAFLKESQSSKTRSPSPSTNASTAEKSQKRGKDNVNVLSKETKRTSIVKRPRRKPKEKAKVSRKETHQDQTDRKKSLRPRNGIQRIRTDFFHPDNYRRQRKVGLKAAAGISKSTP